MPFLLILLFLLPGCHERASATKAAPETTRPARFSESGWLTPDSFISQASNVVRVRGELQPDRTYKITQVRLVKGIAPQMRTITLPEPERPSYLTSFDGLFFDGDFRLYRTDHGARKMFLLYVGGDFPGWSRLKPTQTDNWELGDSIDMREIWWKDADGLERMAAQRP
jgi:hypothetical protein